MSEPLQRTYLDFGCFGCGLTNAHGLRLACYPDGEEVVAAWTPEPHHQGPPDVLHGGVIGALFDCHGAWTAVHHGQYDEFVPIVTAEYTVRLRRPTPLDAVELRGRVVEAEGRRRVVESVLTARGETTATYRGLYVELPAP